MLDQFAASEVRRAGKPQALALSGTLGIRGTRSLRWRYVAPIATSVPAQAMPARPYTIGAAFASRNGVPLSARSRSNAEGRQRAPYCRCQASI